MARLRYNNSAGALGVALTSSGTTITFAVAPAFATIITPDYIPLVLDPPQGPSPNPDFEIVYLTAFTAGATTGTIIRGQEGTTAIAHNAGAIWAQAPTYTDVAGQPPVGSIVPYAGTGDPPEHNWIIADGRLIDRTVYVDFFNRVGHAYNAGGVDPGGGMVRIPDKRGVGSVGAINMGSAAGAPSSGALPASGGSVTGTDNTRLAAVRGVSYGEVNHTTVKVEMPSHQHLVGSASTNTVNTDHSHSGETDYNNIDTHQHAAPAVSVAVGVANNANTILYSSNLTVGGVAVAGKAAWNGPGLGSTTYTASVGNTGAVAAGYSTNHQHTFGTRMQSATNPGGTPGNYTHAHIVNSEGGNGPHNTVGPCQADSYIVRIA